MALVALTVAFAFVEVAVAQALSRPGLEKLLVLVVAVLGLAAVFVFPLASAVGMMFLTASIFHSGYFSASMGPIQVRAEEVVFLALALVAVVAPRRRTWGGVAGGALATFLALVVLSAWLGVTAGRMTVTDAFGWARPLLFFGSFWVVLRLFPDPQSLRRLLVAGLACGALTGILAIALQLAPSLTHSFQGAGGQEIYTDKTQAGLGALKRIRQPGLAFSYILFWWSLAAAVGARGGRRTVLSGLAAASAVDLLLSFNRNMWIGLIFGLGLMLMLAGQQMRHRLLAGVALGITAVVLTFTVVGGSPQGSARLDPIVARAATVLTPQQLGEESSLRDRAQETAQAWRVIQAHPLSGIGAGADFGVRFKQEQPDGRVWLYKLQLFLHDQWLWLMLIGGVPALLAFLVFFGAVMSKAWNRRTRALSRIALGVGLAMVALSAFVMPYFGQGEFALVIGVVAAAIIRGHELDRARQKAAGIAA
jgi:O-antigen ligase